jgi:long-chain acyl-CoA synthetase
VADELQNVADTVRRAAGRDPAAIALIAGDQRISWADLDARVDTIAAGLVALDLVGDDRAAARVAISLPNVPDFAVAYFGVLRAGLIAVPVGPGSTARELRHVLADSGASVVIGTEEVAAAVVQFRDDLPAAPRTYTPPLTELAGPGGSPTSATTPTTAAAAVTGGEDVAVLMYTSGTAGAPKGAMLSHRALLANHDQLAQLTPPAISAEDVVLLALPLTHAYGLNSGLGAVAFHGATGVLVDTRAGRDGTGTGRDAAAEALDAIARQGVTVVAAVPQMFQAWAARGELPFGSVRLAVSGAAPLDPEVATRFAAVAGRPVHQGYGLTEAAPVVTTALASPAPKLGSIGRPIPDLEVRLVGADGGEIARVGSDGLLDEELDDFDDDAGGVGGTDPGEIVVRGPNLFSGYWPDGREGPDADGWWATGDVAYADADGDLFLVDRLGELILVSGFNVYPHEVELVLAAYPGVAEAAVIGTPHPETGEAVKAFVVLAPGAQVTTADLAAHCERNLARFKIPSEIAFAPDLPHSVTGKVRKVALRAGREIPGT